MERRSRRAARLPRQEDQKSHGRRQAVSADDFPIQQDAIADGIDMDGFCWSWDHFE
jgi:hypothetical protein